MRQAVIAMTALLALAACSMLAGSEREGSAGGAALSEKQVTQLLRDQGYANLSDLRFDGKDWTASATRNGTPVKVDVDRYGIIHIL